MKISLFPFSQLEMTLSNLRSTLTLKNEILLDVGFDTVHGINELTRSLAHLHPHKMSIATLGKLPPPLSEIAQRFKAEGYGLVEIPVRLQDGGKLNDVELEKLKKDTLFVLATSAEPLTGFEYPVASLRAWAQPKNIFIITYWGPGTNWDKAFDVAATEGSVIDPLWGESLAPVLLLKGNRLQGERILWGTPQWHPDVVSKLSSAVQRPPGIDADQNLVLKFESQIKTEFPKFVSSFGSDVSRAYDRAVLFFSGINGDAVSSKLKEMKYEAATAASCSWNYPWGLTWLTGLGLTEAQAEGALILPLHELKKSTLAKDLAGLVSDLAKRAAL